MRKCRLCGKLIRRRAEFCRYCTVPQPGAAPNAVPQVAGGPPQVPAGAPDAPTRATTRPPVDTAVLEAAMQPPRRAHDDDVPASLDASAPPRHDVEPPPVYDVRPPETPRAELPAEFETTRPVVPREPVPRTFDADGDVQPAAEAGRSEGEQLVLLDVPPDPPVADAPPPTVVHAGGNGHRNGNGDAARNGHDRNGQDLNGHDHDGTNSNGAEPASTPAGWSRDALLGFEHFPEAPPRRRIRWG